MGIIQKCGKCTHIQNSRSSHTISPHPGEKGEGKEVNYRASAVTRNYSCICIYNGYNVQFTLYIIILYEHFPSYVSPFHILSKYYVCIFILSARSINIIQTEKA